MHTHMYVDVISFQFGLGVEGWMGYVITTIRYNKTQ